LVLKSYRTLNLLTPFKAENNFAIQLIIRILKDDDNVI